MLLVLHSQAEMADLVLLNKCDRAIGTESETAKAWIREIRSEADIRLRRGVRTETDADLSSGRPVAPPNVHGPLVPCRDLTFHTVEFAVPKAADLDALAAPDALPALATVVRGGAAASVWKWLEAALGVRKV